MNHRFALLKQHLCDEILFSDKFVNFFSLISLGLDYSIEWKFDQLLKIRSAKFFFKKYVCRRRYY